MWTLTGFGDEVADDLDQQVELLNELGVRYIEFRSAWGINVLKLDDEQLALVKQTLDRAGIAVSSVGSPIGKISITDDFAPHVEAMERALHVAHYLGAPNIRIFSFFIPEGEDPNQYRDEVLRRMSVLVAMARESGVRLLHENEKDIYGDLPERCADLAEQFGGEHFRLIFDPANYVQVGVRPFDQAWPLVADQVVYLHVKDAIANTPDVVPAGEGDGQLREVLAALKARDYAGFMSIEPHLGQYNAFGALSGPEQWTRAHHALVGLIDELDVARD